MNIKNTSRNILLIIVLTLLSCQKQSEKLFKKQYFIFGTIVEVLVWNNNKELVDKALVDVEIELNGMHSKWHAWKPGALNKINLALRAGKSITITDEQAEFIETTKQLSLQSLGNFNPAIGELIHMWGFHTDEYPIIDAPPNKKSIQEFLQFMPKMADIIISNNTITSKNSHIWLDYGGVAKGYAIDKAINILKKHGIENAIVNAGGDLRSIGSKGDKNWKVAIRKPNSEDIFAGDESIFTSGNYERYKEFNSKRYAHIINPKTGYGVEHIVSATVITDNGTKADAAATALIVAGTDNWKSVMQSMNLDQVLLINEQGQCFATSKMLERVKKMDVLCKN